MKNGSNICFLNGWREKKTKNEWRENALTPTLTTLTVQGQPAEADNHTSTRSQQQTVTLSSTPARSQWSGWTSVAGYSQNTIRSKLTASSGYPLKIVQARILRFDGGKPQFERVGQVFVNITDYGKVSRVGRNHCESIGEKRGWS